MIKGKFVAQIEIDISVDNNTPGLLPFSNFKNFDHFKTGVEKDLCVGVENILKDEFGHLGTISVTQLYADAWMALKDETC